MSKATGAVARDVFLNEILVEMSRNSHIVLLSADFGSPVIDSIKNSFSDRFMNVGIAEQNLINVAMGLACEGYIVFAYAIAPFISMRAFEQIRTNLSLHSTFKKLNINMLSVGAGISYDISGPSHHCIEDIALMRLLPAISLYSPSDIAQIPLMFQHCLSSPTPKYFRLDSKPLPSLYNSKTFHFENGFNELVKGNKILIATTGYMVKVAQEVALSLNNGSSEIGVIDVFRLKPINAESLRNIFMNYKHIITLEEGFVNAGGLDSLIGNIILDYTLPCRFDRFGFSKYLFNSGGREHLHALANIDAQSLKKFISEL